MVVERHNWPDAKQSCVDMGARLMEVRTQEEFQTARKFYNEIGSYFWIGATNRETEGNWVWDSNQEEVNLNEFGVNGTPTENQDNNCLAMRSNGMFDWRCGAIRKFVCEYN